MVLQRARYALVERLASRLIAESKTTAPSVPVEQIALNQGCEIKVSDLKDVSGILVRSPGGNVIGVNRRQNAYRQRFTIAHELGHFLLHEGEEVTFDREFRVSLRSGESSMGTNIEEVEANFFAASLLMPDSLLGSDERTASIELENERATKALAEAYKVSTQAMTLRLARLIDRRGRSAVSGAQARLYL